MLIVIVDNLTIFIFGGHFKMAKESTFKELAKDVLDMVIGECPIPNDEECAEINAEIARLEKLDADNQ